LDSSKVPDIFEAQGQQTRPNRIEVVQGLIAGFPRCEMLEVGSWTGHGAICWRGAIEKLPERGSVTCVDPWRPYLREWDLAHSYICKDMHDWLLEDEVYELFLRNTSFGQFATPIYHHRATLREVAERLPRFDLIYIDGSHYYEDVLSDIVISRTLLKPAGILCGDDLERQMDERDEAKIRESLDVEFDGECHPGVTAAVWDSFGRVQSKNSVWWVQ